jgi:hypothetical protein
MAPVAAIFQAAGSALQALGSIRGANAARKTSEFNARNLEAQAGTVSRLNVDREEAQRANTRQQLGMQLAAGAEAGGGLGGSDLDLLRASMFNSEMDALNIRYQGQLEAKGLTDEARMVRAQGKEARTRGYMSAAAQLMQGSASYTSSGGQIPNFEGGYAWKRNEKAGY